jgi:hypothetical protein
MVTGVELSPSVAVLVAPGSTRQFSATVTGTNSPSQTVTWTLVGANNTGTTIGTGGSLTVASGETAAIFKVRATSTADGSISGETTVSTKRALFVAVSGNRAAFSHDGIIWTAATLPVSVSRVTYGDGRFVAVAANIRNAAYSTDGITWTTATTPPSDGKGSWQGLAYGNGKFVAVAQGSIANTTTAYSEDGGNTWTMRSMPLTGYWYRVTYGGDRFVAIPTCSGASNKKAAYSTTGTSWTTGGSLDSSGYGYNWEGLTYGNGKFVAVSKSGTKKAAYSTDGTSWTSATMPNTSVGWYGVAYGNGKFRAIAYDSNKTAYSANGSTWTEGLDMPSSDYWSRVVYGDGKFVAIASSSTKAAYLTDSGTSWQEATLPSSMADLAVRTD